MPDTRRFQRARQATSKKNKTRINRIDLSASASFLTPEDLDANGLVDGSETTAYQIYNAGNPFFLTKRGGATLSNATSDLWSAIAAAPSDNGHIVLIANNKSRKNKYRIWTLNDRGVLRSRGPWLLGSMECKVVV